MSRWRRLGDAALGRVREARVALRARARVFVCVTITLCVDAKRSLAVCVWRRCGTRGAAGASMAT